MPPIESRLRERHAAVHTLLGQGHGIREIARILHLGQHTVQRAARAQTPEQLLGGRQQPRPSSLDPYKPYLAKRWGEGCTNATTLHAELTELGYRGSYQIISDHLRPTRRVRIRVAPPAPPGARQVTGWIMRRPDGVSNEDRAKLAVILAHCPELAATARHVRAFARIMATRTGQHLKDWIAQVRIDDLPGLHSFAAGLERAWDAVSRGLTTEWNSGLVEGRVNHIKMLKRQMYGRAGLALLRKRVLLTAVRER